MASSPLFSEAANIVSCYCREAACNQQALKYALCILSCDYIAWRQYHTVSIINQPQQWSRLNGIGYISFLQFLFLISIQTPADVSLILGGWFYSTSRTYQDGIKEIWIQFPLKQFSLIIIITKSSFDQTCLRLVCTVCFTLTAQV